MTKSTPIPDPTRVRSWLLAAVLLTATGVAGIASQRSSDPTPAAGGLGGTSTDGSVSLTATPDRGAVLQGGDGLVRLELLLGAAERPRNAVQVPTDLVVVLDRSGSMQGEKIQTARAAIHQLLSQLERDDRFGLVAFSSDAEVAIPLSHPTPEAFTSMSATVNSLRAGGGTYMSTGLDLGLGMIESARATGSATGSAAGRAPRMVLISDGLAAEGHDVLRAQALRAAVSEFALSAVGVGQDFDETLMSALADAGTGNYYYLDDIRELAGVFRDEFATARETVASGLAVTLSPAHGVEVVDAAGYPLERQPEHAVFRPGSLFAGQERRVWVTLRVPTAEAGDHPLGAISLAYTDERGDRARIDLGALPQIARVARQEEFLSALDDEGWARSVATEEWGRVRQEVAGYVKRGQKDRAQESLRSFQARNRELNLSVAAPSVAKKLEEARQLEAEIDGAFHGDDQAGKQNRLGKSLDYDALLERRVGARK